MNGKVESEFKGYINTIKFDNQKVFSLIIFILIKIENKFGEVYTDEFIDDLQKEFNILENILSNDPLFNTITIFNEIASNVNNASKFEQLYLTACPFFESIGNRLKKGYYTKK